MLSSDGFVSHRPTPSFMWRIVEACDLRVPDSINKTVVFIGRADNGLFVPYGTGFFVVQPFGEDVGHHCIVTAKHVIEKIRSKIVHLRVNTAGGLAQVVSTYKESWIFHPDERVDAAICPVLMPHDQFDTMHFSIGPYVSDRVPNVALSAASIESENVGIGDEVYISGMFIGRLGEQKNIPVLRIGTIAAMPGEPLRTQYGFHEAILIEARSIDGLSGSPVCVHVPVDRTLPPGLKRMVTQLPRAGFVRPDFFLAGMVLGYNEVYGPTDLINIASSSSQPTTRARRVNVPMNTGIAVVLPIWKIQEVFDHPIIKTARDAALKERGDRPFVPTSAAPMGAPPRSRR